jgi:hypothetical protein
MMPTYAFYLLAQFREKRAYPLIVKLFSTPGDMVLEETGEFVTEDLPRVLASLCFGDIEPIQSMIEDPSLNEYVRTAGIVSFAVMVAEDILERDQVIAYFRSLLSEKLEKRLSHVWDGLVVCCLDIGAYELIPEIELAFKQNLVDTKSVSLKNVRDSRDRGRDFARFKESKLSKLIGDVVDEMSWWACFCESEDNSKGISSGDILREMLSAAAEGQLNERLANSVKPVSSEHKVGRNDQCPCGSGKKYKRCCLH